MCGFVGQLNTNIPEPRLIAARDQLTHRGPDDSGYFSAGPVSFGFRRLSILDLSAAGHQPMTSASGRSTIVFNGEIYNYLELRQELQKLGRTFMTGTDTEVILAAYEEWGEKCFERLNGMWALALWDQQRRVVVLSRDRFGEKPLYWCQVGSGYIFGSEIKALHPLRSTSATPNDSIIRDYLAFGFVDHTNQTFYREISQIQPGTYTVLSDREVVTTAYWELRPTAAVHPDDAADRFRELLTDSIRLRLRSDVPIGSCLSGGLDSSAIVLLARQIADQEKTSLDHQTFTAAAVDPRYDERQFSQLVNTLTGSQANEIFPDPEELHQELDRLMWHQDEPFLSLSMFAQWSVMRRVHERGIKVVLDGQGGDEILAGYLPFFGSYLAGLLRRGQLVRLIREWRALQRYHRRSIPDILPTLALYLLPRWLGESLLATTNRIEISALQPSLRQTSQLYPALPHPFQSPLKNHMYRLLTGPGLRALLHSEDRNSMAFSVESRVPFLDHRLAEFTLSVADEQLLSSGETKRLLRRALKSVLPPAIRDRRDKMGFVVPQAEWLRGQLAGTIRQALLSPNLLAGQYLAPEMVGATVTDFLAGKNNQATVVWRWYNLERWLQGLGGKR